MGRLFLKRLKGLSISVGFEHPRIILDNELNPILEYLHEQYIDVVPRETIDLLIQSSDDEMWWEIDYSVIFIPAFDRFNEIVRGIKDGTLQKTENLVSELHQVYKECCVAAINQYLSYCLYYEGYSFLTRTATPQRWWFLSGNSDDASPRPTQPGWYVGENKAIKIAGHVIVAPNGFYAEFEDKPYEFEKEPTWWEKIQFWNDEEDIKRKRRESKWENFLEHLEAEDSEIVDYDGDLTVRRKRVYDISNHFRHYR